MSTVSVNPVQNWTLLRSLEESHLLPADVLNDLRARIDEEDFPNWLVEQGWLTPYQLQRVIEGESRSLSLGQYRILDELGRGGFGQVYKAVHTMMDRIVALKVIAPEWVQDPGVRDLFLREVKGTTRLVHPNIALAYDANEIDGVLFFAMEFVAGPTLEQLVLQRGPLPISFASVVMLQTAQALQFAHELGMVHRDIKPANLILPGADFVTERPDRPLGLPSVLVKVVDFGLARLYPRDSPQSFTIQRDGAILGSPAYMSPEQACDYHDVDIRSDLYSLGCTFYFALTGKPPFDGSTAVETLAMQLERNPEALQLRRPGLPADVASIVHRLMHKKAEQRFQTPARLAEALGEALRSRWLRDTSVLDGPPQPGAASASGEFENMTRTPLDQVAPAPDPVANKATAPPAGEDGNCAAPSDVTTDDALHLSWRQWCSVVHGFVLGNPPRVDDSTYRALHRRLVRTARAGANPLSNSSSDRFERMQTLVEPWLSLDTLANTDRNSLIGLWRTCLQMDHGLASPRRSLISLCRAWLLVLVFLFGLLAGSLVLFKDVLPFPAALRTIRLHPLLLLACISLAFVGLIVFIPKLSRSRRSNVHEMEGPSAQ